MVRDNLTKEEAERNRERLKRVIERRNSNMTNEGWTD
jgi:hypothetical protein